MIYRVAGHRVLRVLMGNDVGFEMGDEERFGEVVEEFYGRIQLIDD